MATTQPMPVRNPMIEPDSGIITRPWRIFLRGRADVVAATPQRTATASLAKQTGPIGATVVPGTYEAGLYRVSVYARRTKVATTSSKLQVVISFEDGGQLLAISTNESVSNTLDDIASGNGMIRIDPDTVIQYEVIYDSVAPNEMEYSLDVVVERLQ